MHLTQLSSLQGPWKLPRMVELDSSVTTTPAADGITTDGSAQLSHDLTHTEQDDLDIESDIRVRHALAGSCVSLICTPTLTGP